MFCLVYKFEIKPGKEERFVNAWEEVTREIYSRCGSLGSRLHRTNDSIYIAYAQWPSREIWERASIPFGIGINAQEEMRQCCDRIDTIYELEVASDLLKRRLSEDEG